MMLGICLVVLCVAAGLCAWAWLLRVRIGKVRAAADLSLKTADAMLAASKQERELAGCIMAHVRKVEESLVRPRFAMSLESGMVRALRCDEAVNAGLEVETVDPDPNCRACFGKGWTGRDRATGRVIPCKCVRRRA